MKFTNVVVICALILCTTALAEMQLERAEVLGIFNQLTSNPQKTWIPAGTIIVEHEQFQASKTLDSSEITLQANQAIDDYMNLQDKHLKDASLQKLKLDAIPFNTKYKLSNEFTMTTQNLMKFAGEKYYREITVQNRTDSVVPNKDLSGNIMLENFNVQWNQKRIFAWDGDKFTMYTPSMDAAIVDAAENMPHSIGGEARMGKIPWGLGRYTYDNLASMDCTAIQESIGGLTQIKLIFGNFEGNEVVITLAPDKNLAVLSCVTNKFDGITVSKIYSDYIQIDENWVPQLMVFEEFDNGSNRLLSRNIWEITSVDTQIPSDDNFVVDFQMDTLVEYYSPITEKSQKYRDSAILNSDALLAERFEFIAGQGIKKQNCATAALKFAANQLGKQISDSQLENIIDSEGVSSLLDIKQLAQNNGLFTKSIRTDAIGLQNLSNCQVILHIPGKKHFVVLESADSEYIRLVDITSDKFNYKVDTEFFSMDWPDGVALLISDSPLYGNFEVISDSELAVIKGDAGYSCTYLLQEFNAIFCEMIAGMCGANYVQYWERLGCEAAESGSCSQSWMYRTSSSPCVTDLDDPWSCIVTGEWTHTWIRACM